MLSSGLVTISTRVLTSPSQPIGLSGPAVLSTPSNVLQLDSAGVSFISCDHYEGEIQAAQVFEAAVQTVPAAVVLYSSYSDYCQLTDYTSGSDYTNDYPWVYTLKTHDDAMSLLSELEGSTSYAVYATIGAGSLRSANASRSTASDNDANNQNGAIPPGTPSTAVAMIILYSITGIITALFLVIIITGAIRARRHPERYGPRNVIGRPRQSRARGLARAMLDTLPIVKFGEQNRDEEPKPTDVEMADQSLGTNHATSEQVNDTTQQAGVDPTSMARQSIEQGISAAVAGGQHSSNPDHLGCSICTEDFQAGEDQRVLPCDHRFHPTCIDPWLLNVSGTCPLCRVDLRPQASNGEESGEVDENGNPLLREPGSDLQLTPPEDPNAPPLRMGVRRSIIEGFRSLGGRDRMLSREEQLAALQQMRSELIARRQQQSAREVAEEERSTRQRLRRAFGIRTRQTGQAEEAPREDVEGPEVSPSNSDRRRDA